jgi:hypothetical protein
MHKIGGFASDLEQMPVGSIKLAISDAIEKI